jgi:predicted enzyme related to lactoylglutathione lyase
MEQHAPVITWFEIPARDYEAAIGFYEAVVGTTLRRERSEVMGEFAMFPADSPAQATGCVARAVDMMPAAAGTIVYLWVGDTLAPALARAEARGARIAYAPTDLPDGIGRVAQIIDPEGNRVGLHARA